MSKTLKSTRSIAALMLLVAIGLGACSSVGTTAPSPVLQQQIEAARTPADHEALGAHYRQEAATARTNAEYHRKMAKSYQGMVAGGRGGASMPSHCNALVTSYEGIAAEYDALAASHVQMALQAKQ